MSGPAWLADGLAVLMIVIAVYCAGRLAVSRLRGRDTEFDADGLHVLMGVAMAGMLEPQLTSVPGAAWRVVFAAAAAWFAWQAVRSRGRPVRARCAHPVPHAVESAAMVYMLLPVGSWPSGRRAGMAMPGMSLPATAGNPALALVLALFMLGYALWAIDRLAGLSRVMAAATAQPAVTSRSSPAGVGGTAYPGSALAPRLATCHKIAMAITMGYMLVAMLLGLPRGQPAYRPRTSEEATSSRSWQP